MNVRALRGVCVGPARHLLPGEVADLDSATVQFLVSISAVEVVAEPVPAPEPPAPAVVDEPKPEITVPAKKTGKKEK
jgi:hypothetical protein